MPSIARALGLDKTTIGLSLAVVIARGARQDLAAAFLFPALVIAYAVNTGRAARMMQSGPIYVLGVISFSLYLIHNPFRPVALELLRAASPNPVGAIPALLFALAGSFAVIPFAWLTDIGIERPGRALLRGLVKQIPSRRPVPVR